MYLSIYLSIYLSLSLCLSVCLSTCLSASLKTKLLCETFSAFWTWQHQKRSNSARLPDYLIFLNLTTSKMKQFCEPSSIFKVDNIKNEAILRDFLQKWKVECRADGLVPMRVAIFPFHLFLSLMKSAPRPPNISDEHVSWTTAPCRSSSNVPRLPSFLEILQNPHVLLGCRIPCTCHTKPHPNFKKCSENGVFCAFWLRHALRATTACTFSTSQLPKVLWSSGVLYILTSECASRHNGVLFFDISTSKSAPRLRCFVHFDFEMFFVPERRALFQQLNFQKCSEPISFSTFDFEMYFFNISTSKTAPTLVCFIHFDFEMCFAPQRRARFRHLNVQKCSEAVFNSSTSKNVPNPSVFALLTPKWTFSTSQLPKVLRPWYALYMLTSKCASRHNRVHFFDISISNSGPNVRCF